MANLAYLHKYDIITEWTDPRQVIRQVVRRQCDTEDAYPILPYLEKDVNKTSTNSY